jgi:uncharacterized protein (TIGR00255 family)
MTGHGDAMAVVGGLRIAVEIRSVNNRHLKISSRVSSIAESLEPQIDNLLREFIRRGTVQVQVRVEQALGEDAYQLNETALKSYVDQCRHWAAELGLHDALSIRDLLSLPGVISTGLSADEKSEEVLQATLGVVRQAAIQHQAMRAMEGKAMANALSASIMNLQQHSSQIAERSPIVLKEHSQRLEARVKQAFEAAQHTFQPSDLLREIQIMADRLDIHEEVVRLRSHLEQFLSIVHGQESQGRKLDFLIQEIFRETNTIGSKASDVTIARHVIEMKTTIEQMREIVQNIE